MTWPATATLLPGEALTYTVRLTAPATGFTATATVSSATTDPVPANNSAARPTAISANQAPVAQDVVSTVFAPMGETAGRRAISPLATTDTDGTVASYTVTALPPAAQGVLYYDNAGTPTAVTVGTVLTPA